MPRELIYKDEAYSAVLHDNPQFAYCINRMKPVDAVEVVHSRWVNIVTIVDGLCLGFCENCRTEQKAHNATALKAYHKYCRWCGAKMDGGNDNERS